MTTVEGQQPAQPPTAAANREQFDAAQAALADYLAAADLGVATSYLYRSLATRFLRHLGSHGIDLGKTTRQEVDDFLHAHDLVVSTQSSYRGILRRLFGVLVARGLMPANPLDGDGYTPSELPLTIDNVRDQFASFTGIERQATVDAADYALLFHGIYLFTEGKGGREAGVPLCEAALQLGEEYGITPFPWIEDRTSADGVQDGRAAEQPVEAHA